LCIAAEPRLALHRTRLAASYENGEFAQSEAEGGNEGRVPDKHKKIEGNRAGQLAESQLGRKQEIPDRNGGKQRGDHSPAKAAEDGAEENRRKTRGKVCRRAERLKCERDEERHQDE